jgi:Domain of unknown function (DUF4149)
MEIPADGVHMKMISFPLYNLILALWAGGITLFTFVVTPVIFKSYGKDAAGDIVGKLFPGYFAYNLILSVLAVILFFLVVADRSLFSWRLSAFFLSIALIINLFVLLKLHPATVKAKQEISSFDREPSESPAHRKFRKLHAVSAGLNLFLLADGVTLLIAGSFLKK